MLITLIALVLTSQVEKPPESPPPVLSVMLVWPQHQLTELLAAFKGTKASSPASALAQWKKAKPGRALSKAVEAGIASLNPEMVNELKALDQASFFLRVKQDGTTAWWAGLPEDDGTFAALATAMVLTDGSRVEPFRDQPVDRLGPSGTPLMTRGEGGRGVVLASSREELAEVHQRPFRVVQPEQSPGFLMRLAPAGLRNASQIPLRQLGEGLLGAGCQEVRANGLLNRETLTVSFAARYDSTPALGTGRINPNWLDPIPSRRLIAAWAFAIDPTPSFWDSVFAWADGIEKADPARAGVAPLRLRLSLLTAAAKIRPEADLLPYLKGLSGHLTEDDKGTIGQGVLCLHLTNPDRAKALVGDLLPRLARSLGLGESVVAPDGTRSWIDKGSVGVIEARESGASVWIGWGKGALNEAKLASETPEKSAGRELRTGEAKLDQTQRFVMFRPALSSPQPRVSRILWTGRCENQATTDLIVWSGLQAEVKQSIDQLLSEVPPSAP